MTKRLLGKAPPTPTAIVAEAAAETNRLYAWLAPDTALTQLYDGHFIFVDPLDEQISIQMIARGYWEAWVEKAVRALIKPGDRIVEVGANIGYYTLLMAKDVGPSGRVDSFEANPNLSRLLSRSVSLNGYDDRVTVFANAASNAAGPLTFLISRSQSGAGHIESRVIPAHETTPVVVQGVRIDDVLPGAPYDLMRIDAEGSEPFVLGGAWDLVRRSPNLKICLEWDVIQMEPRAHVPDFVDHLASFGFSFWLIEVDASLTPLTPAQLLNLPHSDIVASRTQPF